jgi:hypothetical protein
MQRTYPQRAENAIRCAANNQNKNYRLRSIPVSFKSVPFVSLQLGHSCPVLLLQTFFIFLFSSVSVFVNKVSCFVIHINLTFNVANITVICILRFNFSS